jgi:hypothetical protein
MCPGIFPRYTLFDNSIWRKLSPGLHSRGHGCLVPGCAFRNFRFMLHLLEFNQTRRGQAAEKYKNPQPAVLGCQTVGEAATAIKPLLDCRGALDVPRKDQKVLIALIALLAHISLIIGGTEPPCPPPIRPVKAASPKANTKLINSKFGLLGKTKDLRALHKPGPHHA